MYNLPTRWAPPKASVLEFQGEGAIRLVEKKLSIAFCALSSTSLSGLNQEIINTPTYTLFLHMMQYLNVLSFHDYFSKYKVWYFQFWQPTLFISLNLHSVKVPLYTVYKIRCQKSMRDQQSSTKFYIWWCFWVHTWFAGTLAFRQCLLGEVQLCVLLTSGKVSTRQRFLKYTIVFMQWRRLT